MMYMNQASLEFKMIKIENLEVTMLRTWSYVYNGQDEWFILID